MKRNEEKRDTDREEETKLETERDRETWTSGGTETETRRERQNELTSIEAGPAISSSPALPLPIFLFPQTHFRSLFVFLPSPMNV